MTDTARLTVTTTYTVTHAECLPNGVGVTLTAQPEDNPWYILHTRAEVLRTEWRQAADRLADSSLPVTVLRHVSEGLSDAEEQLCTTEALGLFASDDARVLTQARETLEGLASATARLGAKNDVDLLASWLAGQGAQLRGRLEAWLPRHTSTPVQPATGVTLVYDAELKHDFSGGWVA